MGKLAAGFIAGLLMFSGVSAAEEKAETAQKSTSIEVRELPAQQEPGQERKSKLEVNMQGSAAQETEEEEDAEMDADMNMDMETMPGITMGSASEKSGKSKTKANAFIAPLYWQGDGYISGDKDKKIMISDNDTVYVTIDSSKVRPGLVANVYRKVGKVKDPESKKVTGYEMRRVGKVRFTSEIEGGVSSAVVIMSYEAIEINDTIKIEK